MKIIKGFLLNWFTTLAGGLAGVPEIIEGVTAHDYMKIMKGVALLLLGLVAKDAGGKTVEQIVEDLKKWLKLEAAKQQ